MRSRPLLRWLLPRCLALAGATASADPGCPDVHWIGAAGSGERGPEATINGGMGRVVYQSFNALKQLVEQDGRTITAEAVEYPAIEVPEDGGMLDWANFMGSVDTGAAALGGQYESFVQRCPATKVVLAGYSQGAMVVHRNLHALAGESQSGRLAVDRRRRPAADRSHDQHRFGCVDTGRREGRRAGLADLGARSLCSVSGTRRARRSACATVATQSATTTKIPRIPKH